MSSRPGLLKRWGQTGIPLLVARLILGVMFVWMGLTKTGLVKTALNKTGLTETAVVKSMIDGGMIELSNPIDFLKLIREYHIIPDNTPVLLNLVAAVLPWFEVLCGLLLITGVAIRGTALIFMVLLAGFTIMVAMRAISIYNTQDIPFCSIKFDCGCGAGVVYICRKLPENTFLLLLSIFVLLSRSRKLCLWRDIVPARSTSQAVQS